MTNDYVLVRPPPAHVRRPPVTLDGATTLVTGAGSGIGRATAHALAASGATVLCTDIDEAAAEKNGSRVHAHAGMRPIRRTDSTWRTGAEVDCVAARVDRANTVRSPSW